MARVRCRPLRHRPGARRRWGDGHLRALLEAGAADAIAFVEDGRRWTYAKLREAVATRAAELPSKRQVLVVACGADAYSAIGYLAALSAGHVALLVEAGADDARVRELYAGATDLHPELRVLLSTSGSTGSPKLVRLSEANLLSNARAIAAYLELTPEDRAIGSLPLPYSFGMSVLHSHLVAGASMVFTMHSAIRPEFWADVREHGVTSFAGVPYAYAMLERVGVRSMTDVRLRYMTQAGGGLDPELAAAYGRHVRFFVMYGQTEASPRISYVPPERLADKPGSIGVAIPGGALRVTDEGELEYSGPNVMLGYARSAEELALGDVMGGVLATGDLGHADDDGFFYVTGRTKRIAKVYGLRLSLDEVEAAIEGPAAAVAGDERIVVYAEREVDARALARRWRLPPRALQVVVVDALPVKGSGKVDYAALADG